MSAMSRDCTKRCHTQAAVAIATPAETGLVHGSAQSHARRSIDRAAITRAAVATAWQISRRSCYQGPDWCFHQRHLNFSISTVQTHRFRRCRRSRGRRLYSNRCGSPLRLADARPIKALFASPAPKAALHHVVRIRRHRPIAPKPSHHIGQNCPAHLLPMEVHAPRIIHVAAFRVRGFSANL